MPEIRLRPITILVGRNSAGKSTFLRTLPLIKQSLRTRTSAPILWYGDYVDFGDFESAVSDNDSDKTISFSFRIEELSERYRPFTRNTLSFARRNIKIEVDDLRVTYSVRSNRDKTFLSGIILEIPSEDISFEITLSSSKRGEGVWLSGINILPELQNYNLIALDNDLFDLPYFITKKKGDNLSGRSVVEAHELFRGRLFSLLRAEIPNNVGDATVNLECRRILSANHLDKPALIEWARIAHTQNFRKLYSNMATATTGDIAKSVRHIWELSRAFVVLEVLSSKLEQFFRTVTYLGPARARSERFYRKQELEVSEIAPDGQNFPMFLASLHPAKLGRFSEYVKGLFGYGIAVENREGHISVKLTADNHRVNVTDTGYGVSQLLPVLGQIWAARDIANTAPRSATGGRRMHIVAIEQPELHLHPAHQALLADVLAQAVTGETGKEGENGLNMVVETHSEALISRLGEMIEQGDISHEDVQIVIFNATDDIYSPTDIQIAKFDEDGILIDWPYGFFNYASHDIFS